MARRHGRVVCLAAWTIAFVAHAAAQDSLQPPLPLEVDFSVPVEGEADVRLNTIIRVQFSRDVDAKSFDQRVRVSYSAEESSERGEATPPKVVFKLEYQPGSHSLTIKPSQPLERFRQVTVDLLDGIVGTDGSVLRAWTLHFSTGGS